MNSIINVKNFNKTFGKKEVIKDLSFEVYKGDIFAFLGANGMGKTTTLRCLLNIYEPSSGQLLINNQRYSPSQANILGYLPEERGLYVTSKVLETMIYFGQLKGMSYQASKDFSIDYLKRVELSDKQDEKINKLSSGQQQKIQLGITIINKPKLLILDEPTKGLDPLNRSLLLDILMDLNKQGSTIVFSTHQMEEVEKIANRLLMIKDGKSVLYGEVGQIKDSFGTNTIHVNFSGNFPTNNSLYEASLEGHTAEITPNPGIESGAILKYLLQEGLDIKEFTINAPSLNDIFIKISKEDV